MGKKGFKKQKAGKGKGGKGHVLQKTQFKQPAKQDKRGKSRPTQPTASSILRARAGQKVLLIGEGNFSFSLALCRMWNGDASSMVCTAYDSYENAQKKYNDLDPILDELRSSGADIRFEVDATRLSELAGKHKKKKGKGPVETPATPDEPAQLAGTREGAAPEGKPPKARLQDDFDLVIFNFPHAGLGIKDQDRNLIANQTLLQGFFTSLAGCQAQGGPGGASKGPGRSLLKKGTGEVHMAIKRGLPYENWKVCGVAREAAHSALKLKGSHAFDPEGFPGYSFRRTLGHLEGLSASHNEELSKGANVYVWQAI